MSTATTPYIILASMNVRLNLGLQKCLDTMLHVYQEVQYCQLPCQKGCRTCGIQILHTVCTLYTLQQEHSLQTTEKLKIQDGNGLLVHLIVSCAVVCHTRAGEQAATDEGALQDSPQDASLHLRSTGGAAASFKGCMVCRITVKPMAMHVGSQGRKGDD